MRLPRSLPGVFATAALAAAFCCVVLGFVAGLVVLGDHTFEYYGADPASTLDASRFVGLLSHAGILLAWGAGVAAVLAGTFLARADGWRDALPLVLAGAGTAYLAFDDLFRLHEDILPRLRIEEEAILGAYGVAALAFLWWYRRVLVRREWPLLALAAGALGTSVALDQKIADFGSTWNRWVEDGLKFVGLAFLALYLVRLSFRMLGDAYPLDPRRDDAARAVRAGSLATSVVLVAALCVALLSTVAVLVSVSENPFRYYTKDPASTLSASALVGLISHVGVLLAWGAGLAAVVAGAFVARARGRRDALPLLVAGAGTAYLALADLFRLHGGIGLDPLFVAYVAGVLVFLWWCRDLLREDDGPLLALALGVLGGSFLLDLAGAASWLRDSVEVLGIAFVAAYVLRLSGRMLVDAYPLTPAARTEAGYSSAEPPKAVATPSPT